MSGPVAEDNLFNRSNDAFFVRRTIKMLLSKLDRPDVTSVDRPRKIQALLDYVENKELETAIKV